MTMTDQPDADPTARLAARLALPERPADESFVARVGLALEARVFVEEARRDRREAVLVEVLAGAGLVAAAHQLTFVGETAAPFLAPLATGIGGIALLWALVWLLLSGISGEREGLA
jgi:hypothetical protein